MKETIRSLIRNFVQKYSIRDDLKTRWREPIVKYAQANDTLFYRLKEIVGPTHALPQDFLEDAQTVISYFIPFAESVIKSNVDGKYSSKEWAIAYLETNELISALNGFLKQQLEDENYKLTNIPATHNFDKESLKSDWSHRHAAYIAGLGTFGLNNMLITDQGCCGRVGSIITNIKIEPSSRPENEICLYKSKGICKKCVQGCEAKALTTKYFDRKKCYQRLLEK